MDFSFFSAALISNFIQFWLKNTHDVILIFLKLYRLVLWPNIWSILSNVLCVLKNNLYLLLFGRMFYICLLGCLVYMLLNSSVILLLMMMFCLDALSIIKIGVLKSPTITVKLSISPLSLFIFVHMFRYSNVGCIYFLIFISLLIIDTSLY